MDLKITSLEYATLEPYLAGVLADVERGHIDRRTALPMLMGPLKRILSGNGQGVFDELTTVMQSWSKRG